MPNVLDKSPPMSPLRTVVHPSVISRFVVVLRRSVMQKTEAELEARPCVPLVSVDSVR